MECLEYEAEAQMHVLRWRYKFEIDRNMGAQHFMHHVSSAIQGES